MGRIRLGSQQWAGRIVRLTGARWRCANLSAEMELTENGDIAELDDNIEGLLLAPVVAAEALELEPEPGGPGGAGLITSMTSK